MQTWRLASLGWLLAASLGGNELAVAQQVEPARKLTTQELADWIDRRFAEELKKAQREPAGVVDDATYLRRTMLDLVGRIPSVAELRDFLANDGSFKRQDTVEMLLNDERRPHRYSQRSAENLGRVWRRMMIPASSPGAAMSTQLEPWLAKQFEANTPYDQFARKLLLVAPSNPGPRGIAPAQPAPADPDAAAGIFQQAVGASPENLATAYVRVFLGVRIGCAQCHDHPLADWKRRDFWGMAALFTPTPAGDSALPPPMLRPENATETYAAQLLWASAPLKEIPAGKSPRQVLADWLTSPENPNFAATAVNRTWQYLCGRGLAGSVDDLDRVEPEERQLLDELARLFVDAGFDMRWLIAGICKSRVYQQVVTSDEEGDSALAGRPLKSLLPEQVFDSLEEALHLPIAAVDKGPRFNGERTQFVSRMNESAPESPTDFKAGIPQALMLMNGKLTADATSLETSRTLRAVVEAPFLTLEERLDTLYLAALSRKAKPAEREFLLKLVHEEQDEDHRKQVFAEIYWGLLNSPEFVLSR
jgi:hypothetical protein